MELKESMLAEGAKKLGFDGWIDPEAGKEAMARGEDVIGMLESQLVHSHNLATGERLDVLDVYWRLSVDAEHPGAVHVQGIYLP